MHCTNIQQVLSDVMGKQDWGIYIPFAKLETGGLSSSGNSHPRCAGSPTATANQRIFCHKCVHFPYRETCPLIRHWVTQAQKIGCPCLICWAPTMARSRDFHNSLATIWSLGNLIPSQGLVHMQKIYRAFLEWKQQQLTLAMDIHCDWWRRHSWISQRAWVWGEIAQTSESSTDFCDTISSTKLPWSFAHKTSKIINILENFPSLSTCGISAPTR